MHMLQDAEEDGSGAEEEGFSIEGCTQGGEQGTGGEGSSYASAQNTTYGRFGCDDNFKEVLENKCAECCCFCL